MTNIKTVKSEKTALTGKINDNLYKIDDPFQLGLYNKLKIYSPQAADAYKGALSVFNSKNNPERFRQSAHSLRMISGLVVRKNEVEDDKDNRTIRDIVLEWLNRFTGSDTPTSKDVSLFRSKLENFKLNHIDNMMTIMIDNDPMGGPPKNSLKEITKKWNKIHQYLNNVSKSGHATENVFKERLFELEKILSSIFGSYYDNRDSIKVMLNNEPSAILAKELLKMITSHKSFEYLFENASADWLKFFEEAGFFALPEDDPRNWPPSKYLLRILQEKPEEVVKIVLLLSISTSPVIVDDIINIALKIDPKFVSPIINVILKKGWVRKGLLGEKYWAGRNVGALVDHLVKNNHGDDALKLFKNLLQFNSQGKGLYSQRTKTLIRDYDYQELLDKHIDGLTDIKSEDVTIIISKILNTTYDDLYKKNGEGGRVYEQSKDYSYLSYRDINDRMQYSRDAKEMLLKALVKRLEYIGEKYPEKIKACLSGVGYPLYIFRMIKIRIYRKFPQIFKNEIIDSLLDEDNYENLEDVGEVFSELIKEQFQLLNKEGKKQFFGIISKRAKYFEKTREDHKDMYFEKWRYRILYLVQKYLDKDNEIWFDSIKNKYSEPNFTQGAITSWTGPTSDISVEGFDKMDSEIIIKELKEWSPPKGNDVDSPEGRGRNLSESIKKDSEKYFSIASEFIDEKIRFTYTYYFFWGLELSHREKHDIDWNAVIDAGLKLVRLTEVDIEKYPVNESDDFEYDYDDTLRSLISLIDQGLNEKKVKIPLERRGDIWEVIEKGLKSSDPDLDHEKKYGGNNMDPMNMSINTTRGESMHALIRYGSWIAQNSEEKKGLPSEVIGKLDYHLEYDNDPTETVHCIYGRYLPFISYHENSWLEKNIELIFPEDPDRFLIWKSAFGAYLKTGMYLDLFSKLIKQYEKALEYVNTEGIDKEGRNDFIETLAHHIMLAVAHGVDGSKDIAIKLFKSNNEKIKERAIFFAGANILNPGLKHVKDIKYPSPENLKWIWTDIMSELTLEAVEGFGFWFVNSPYDPEFSIKQLIKTLKLTSGKLDAEHKINSEFVKYVDNFPGEVLECMEIIIKKDVNNWYMPNHIDMYVELLRKIKSNPNVNLIERVSSLADFLGKKGFEEKFEEFK